MKEVIKKTKEEREVAVTNKEIKVEDTHFFYWTCDDCNVAYFAGDTILEDSKGIHRCSREIKQNIIGKIFFKGKVVCGNHMYGGDEKCFNEYYKFK